MVNTANEEIESLNDFDPVRDVIVHKEFSDYIGDYGPAAEGKVTLTDYRPNRLTYSSTSPSDQFAVFSEIWYGPDKGWQAYIDGEAVEHIRVNYCLRGMKVPNGKHEIVFEFKPQSFLRGESISLISSSIILLALIGMIGFGGWKWYQNVEESKPVKPVEQKRPARKQSAVKPKAKRRKKK